MRDEPNDQSPTSSTAGSTSGAAGANSAAADNAVGEAVAPTLQDAAGESHAGRAARRHPDPTRYGDWEKGGRCIDF